MPNLRLVPLLLVVSTGTGCFGGVMATAGPKVGYAFGRGVTYGWTVSADAYANEVAVLGLGSGVLFGQTWRTPGPPLLVVDNWPAEEEVLPQFLRSDASD